MSAGHGEQVADGEGLECVGGDLVELAFDLHLGDAGFLAGFADDGDLSRGGGWRGGGGHGNEGHERQQDTEVNKKAAEFSHGAGNCNKRSCTV